MAEGKKHGLGINFHADELTALGGAEMGARLGALGMRYVYVHNMMIVNDDSQ